MDSKTDRLDFLKYLTTDSDVELSSYIPVHHNEVYILYSLLKVSSVDYNKIKFFKPKESNKTFIFICTFDSHDDINKLEKSIDSDSILDYKNKKYKITIKENIKTVSLKIKQLE